MGNIHKVTGHKTCKQKIKNKETTVKKMSITLKEKQNINLYEENYKQMLQVYNRRIE